MNSHSAFHIFLIILNFVTYCVTLFVNAASALPKLGNFINSANKISTVKLT